MHNDNWDDLRYVLAVAETGSVLQAAKQLRVNHATVLRHVAAFEGRHGSAVFERTSQGYRLLPDRAHVISAAYDAKLAIQEVNRLAGGGSSVVTGTVRIASTDTLCALVLPQFVASMTVQNRNFDATLLSSNMHLDLLREQAHLVVRPSMKLSDDLVGDDVGELGFAAYALNTSIDKWHNLTGPLSRSIVARWIADAIPSDHMTSASDSFLTLRELAAAGGGISVLPCFVGDADPRLVRLENAMPHLRVPLWVARHIDTVETAQVRSIKTDLIDYLTAERVRLLG